MLDYSPDVSVDAYVRSGELLEPDESNVRTLESRHGFGHIDPVTIRVSLETVSLDSDSPPPCAVEA